MKRIFSAMFLVMLSFVGAMAQDTQQATITSVDVRGPFNSWSGGQNVLELTAENTYTGVLDLSDLAYDQEFKLVVNGNNWIGTGQLTLDAPEGWVNANGNGNNFVLLNGTTGYKSYIFTATWTPSQNPTDGWTLRIEGKDLREEIKDAEIAKVEIRGATDADWQNRIDFELAAGDTNTFTGVLDLTESTNDAEFKLVINDNDWIGTGQLTLDAPEGWVNEGGNGSNFVLNNAETGYQTYTFTATWTPGPDPTAGWMLKIEGKDVRAEVLNTYTVTFTDNVGWEEVYAYAWNGDTKYFGEWPGKLLDKGDDNIYTVTIEAVDAPAYIIFNDGNGSQTEDLPFEDGKAYDNGKAPVIINSMAIVGTFPGMSWDVADGLEMNQEPDNEHVWSLTLEGVEVEATQYEYKAIANGSYEEYVLPAEGNNDFVFGTEEYPAGTYNLTFTANTENHTLTLIADKQATYVDLLTLPGDATYTEGKFFMVEAADEANGNIRLTAGETVLTEIMEDGVALIEITNAAFTSGEFVISADKELTLTKVSLFDDPDAAEGVQIWPEVEQPVVIESMSIIGELTGGWPTEEDWSMAKAMTQDDENEHLWTLTVDEFEVDLEGNESRTYDYKATANGKWGDYELPAEGNNHQEFTEAGTYKLLFTADTEAHTLTLETTKLEVEPENAVVASVELRGEFNEWGEGQNVLQATDVENTYTGVLDLTDITADQEFKLVVKAEGVENEIWIGGSELTPEAPEGWVTAGGENNNFTLKNSTTGYQTYTFTATWTASPDAAAGWTLKIEGKDEREVVEQKNTYTATFTDNRNWEEVYAYAFTTTGEGEEATTKEYLGAWPGTKLEKNDEGKYTVTIEATEAPAFIIFNNNAEEQTADLAFEDKGEYANDPIEVEPENAVIASVELRGEFNEWSEGQNVLQATDVENTYTGVLDLTDITADQEFKLVVKAEGVENEIWIGGSELTPEAPEGWVTAGGENNNFTLKNSTTGYQTYTFTATWTASPDAAAGWTLKIEGKDEREVIEQKNTYTATFTDNRNWEEVYAYAFTTTGEGEETATKEYLGAWPGTKLEKNDEGKYTVTIESTEAPAFIIFNNNGEEQTADLAFEDKGEYANEPIEVEPENAVIASVELRGEFNEWGEGQNVLQATDVENTYTGVLDLTDITADQEFKLVVKAEGKDDLNWIGTNQLTLDAPDGWVAADGEGNNFTLKNSTTGYQTYTFTATWTASPDAAAGWTLKIEGKDEREVVEQKNTYTATFTDNRNWEEVYAYAFTTTGEGEESTTKEYLGAWPGTKLEKNDEGKYTVTIEATEAPAFIIFNNNAEEQTADLTFEDKGEYANDPIEAEPENAVIASVELRGEFNEWSEGQNVLQATDVENTYTGVLDLTDITADQEFKLVVKAEGKDDLNWIGTNQLTLDAPDGWVAADGEGNNFTLKNSTTGYQTYTFTATWTASPDAAAGWTLKIEGKDEREVIEQKNTYTATFTDNRNWEEVYAYAFTTTGEGEEATTKEYLGAWPGTKLEKNDEGKYTVTIESTEAPAFIIFNNNGEEQTADLAFEDKGEYANEPIEVEPENAVIASVELRGEFNEWSEGQNVLQATDVENTYTGVLDLTDITADQEFKLVVKAEGVENDIWIGNGSDTQFNTTEGWIVGLEEGNWNYVLKNSITGFQTYTITASWTPSTDAGKGWTLKIEGKDVREVEIPDAVITNVEIRGAFNDWTAGVTVLEPTDVENVYEGTIDLTATQEDQEFKLVVNAEGVENDIWIGNGSDTQFNTTEGWIVGLEEGDWNYVLKNSITGYQTYTVTAAWTPSTDAGKGWTLTINGKDQRIATGIEAWRTEFEDGHYYNLQGVRITNPKRGVYIHNGQKVVVK